MRDAGLWALRADFLSGAAQQGIADQRKSSMAQRAGQDTAAMSAEWLDNASFATVQDGVAIIPLRGVLYHRFSWWACSYEELARDLELAAYDPRVERIVLDIDSPGGLVAGTDTAGAAIAAARTYKPVQALINGLGCSAAFWVACATEKVWATSRSEIGSVGVMKRGLDFEPIFIKEGAELIEVVAKQSPNKMLDPNSPEGQAELQAIVDHAGGQFVTDLARFRGISEADVMAKFGQGLVFHAEEARSRGMIDAVDIAANVLGADMTDDADLEPEGPDTVTVPEQTEVVGMTLKPNGSGAAAITLDALRSSSPEIVAALIAEAETKAKAGLTTEVTSAVAADRTRMAALDELLAQAGAGAAEIIGKAKADGTSAADAALAIMKAGAHKPGTAMAGLEQDGQLTTGAKPGVVVDKPIVAATPEGWTAAYAASAELQSQFPSAAAYVAHMKYETKKGGAK